MHAAATAGAATPGEISEGNTLRDVTMRGLTGEPRARSAFRGKPPIINMWASYCSPCLQEMGSLEGLSKWYGKQFNVIGIAIATCRRTGCKAQHHFTMTAARQVLGRSDS